MRRKDVTKSTYELDSESEEYCSGRAKWPTLQRPHLPRDSKTGRVSPASYFHRALPPGPSHHRRQSNYLGSTRTRVRRADSYPQMSFGWESIPRYDFPTGTAPRAKTVIFRFPRRCQASAFAPSSPILFPNGRKSVNKERRPRVHENKKDAYQKGLEW
jgi:hypothetical protein